MNDTVKEIHEAWRTSIEQLGALRRAIREDMEMCYGDQWYSVRRNPSKPYLSINFIRGRVKRRSGFIRQNMPEPKVISTSAEGDEFADILQQALKYIYSERSNLVHRYAAIDEALVTGLSWIHIYMDYATDIVNGDVKLMKVSPLDVAFDPYCSSPDMSDMRYIIVRSYLSKEELYRLYPSMKREIELVSPEMEYEYEPEAPRNYKSMGEMVNMFDYWKVETKKERWYINRTTGEYGKYSDDILPLPGDCVLVEKEVPVVTMKRCVGDCILYDDTVPYATQKIPFVPVICYSFMGLPLWEYRIQGITRILKDLQLEKNKRRSSIMHNVLNKFLRGYKKLRDETADLEGFIKTEAQVLEVDSLDSIREFEPPNIPEALMLLEKEIDNDLNYVDANLQMLDSASAYQAVGALQLKLRESLLVDQEIYDNVNTAMHAIGTYCVTMIQDAWSTEKFKRIVGYNMPYKEEYARLEQQAQRINRAFSVARTDEEKALVTQEAEDTKRQVEELTEKIDAFWRDFDTKRSRYDYALRYGEGVEETPTYKLAYLNTFTSLKQQGQYVPDEVYIEFLDIPKRIKETWLGAIQAQQQSQMQLQAMVFEQKKQLEEMKAQLQIVLKDMEVEGKLKLEKLKQEDVYEYDITRRNINANTANNRHR